MANVGAGRVPGDAGLDEPLGELAERVGGSAHARSRRSSPAVSCSLTLVVLAPLFSQLPKAVLAAMIIDAVVFGMIDLAELRRLYRVKRVDFWIALAAIARRALGRRARRCRRSASRSRSAGSSTSPTAPPMPAARARARHARVPGARRASGRRDVPGHRRRAARRRPLLRDRRGARRPASASWSRTTSRRSRAVVLDLEGVDFVDSQGAAKLDELLDLTPTGTSRSGSPASSPRPPGARGRRRARPARHGPHPRRRGRRRPRRAGRRSLDG